MSRTKKKHPLFPPLADHWPPFGWRGTDHPKHCSKKDILPWVTHVSDLLRGTSVFARAVSSRPAARKYLAIRDRVLAEDVHNANLLHQRLVQKLPEDEGLRPAVEAVRRLLADCGCSPTAQATPATSDEAPLPQRQNDDPQQSAVPIEADDLPLGEFLSANDLSGRLPASKDAVESFLRRYRDKHPDCFIENEGRRVNEARYLYRVDEVWPDLKSKFPKPRT